MTRSTEPTHRSQAQSGLVSPRGATIWACSLALLSGCGSFDVGKRYLAETDSVDSSGAYQLADRGVLEPVDVGYLLIRYAPLARAPSSDQCENIASRTPKFGKDGIASERDEDGARETAIDRARLDKAQAFFNCRVEQAGEEQRRAARNGLQGRLIYSSQQRCNAFKTNLQRGFARTNFGLGVLTTIAATAGALVGSAAAAKNWAGTAAIASGSRAEYNQDFFANLAAHVVIDGVDRRRQHVYDQIQRLGQAKAYADYPIEAAIGDAMYYHGQCTIAAGFQEASESIRLANDPGMNAAIQTVARLKAANSLMKAEGLSSDEILKRSAALSSAVPVVAGSVLVNGDAGAPLLRMRDAFVSIETMAIDLKAALVAMKNQLPKDGPPAADLGLDKPADPVGLSSNVAAACLSVEAALLSERDVARFVGAGASDAKQESDQAAKAAAAAAKASLLGEVARRVADEYRGRAELVRAEWSALYDKAVKGDKAAQTSLKASVTTPFVPNAPQVGNLRPLCGLPAA